MNKIFKSDFITTIKILRLLKCYKSMFLFVPHYIVGKALKKF